MMKNDHRRDDDRDGRGDQALGDSGDHLPALARPVSRVSVPQRHAGDLVSTNAL